MRDRLPKQFESWLRKIEGEWAGMNHSSLRVDLELETGLHDYAVVVMATGIIGFRGDKTPIIEARLIRPTMQQLFRDSKPLQQFVRDSLSETYGKRGGWAEKRGEELADKGMAVALDASAKSTWQATVAPDYPTNGVVCA